MNVSRPWLALVVALFCLPLFVGLADRDVEDDEAIYSFAVDRMLETGDWLEPKSIPHEDLGFLEKPPLKFWIVAAPIALGALPHDQFGLRFWDALFGGVAFVYVFLIGSRLIHPICGAVAALVLFAHEPLLFNHGLRGNNMEAPLVLAYCGGLFHFLAYAREDRPARRRGHAVAAGLFFVLGFMTKFVAALFLPGIVAAAAVVVPEYRRTVVHHWRLWVGVGALAMVLIVPWFVWAHLRYGDAFWRVIIGEHVIQRMTSALDPTHIQPWYFYPAVTYARFRDAGIATVLLIGMVVLGVQSVRRRSPEGLLVVIWGSLPLVLMSAGTSKLYHYMYPFLPPLALAVGYLCALLILLGPAPFLRTVRAFDNALARRLPGSEGLLRHGPGRGGLLAACAVALLVAAISMTYGPIRLVMAGMSVRSSGVLRPAVTAFVCALLAGAVGNRPRSWVALLVAALLPLPAYRQSLGSLHAVGGPMRTTRDCIVKVQTQLAGSVRPGLYVDVPDVAMKHSMYYYYRQVRPWVRPDAAQSGHMGGSDSGLAEGRPALLWNPGSTSDVTVLLPGPYAVCAGGSGSTSDRSL